MAKSLCALLLAALAGCSGLPAYERPVSPCDGAEASYACQVQRYHDVAI